MNDQAKQRNKTMKTLLLFGYFTLKFGVLTAIERFNEMLGMKAHK